MKRNTIEKNSFRVVRLKELMREENLTQAQLAEKLNMTQQNLSRIIRSEKLSDVLISDICEIFPEYSPEWIKGTDLEIINHFTNSFASDSQKSSGTAQLLQSLGYTFTLDQDRIMLRSDTDTIELSLSMFSRIQNDLCDYLEFKLSKIKR